MPLRSVFIPGTSARACLMRAIEARIRTLDCDIYNHDVYVLSEIKGMILFGTAGGIFLDAKGEDPQAQFLKRVNDRLYIWAMRQNLKPDNYIVTLED